MQVLLKEHLAISNMYTLYKCLMFTEINLGSVPYGLNSPFESYLKFVQLYLSDGPLDHDHDMEKLLYGCKTSKEMYVLFCRYLALPAA